MSTTESPDTTPKRAARITGSMTMTEYGTLTVEEQKIADEEGVPKQYDVNELISFSAFGYFKGTVLQSSTLWKETLALAILYWVVFSIGYRFRWKGFSGFVGEEGTIRAFIAMFSELIGLLLSFYTSFNLGRWWQMRVAVQHIIEGSKQLSMLVGNGVSQSPVLLSSINRYARASLFLIFQESRRAQGSELPRVTAQKIGLLTPEEADKLEKANAYMTFVQAETLWTWLASWVDRMHELGLIKGSPHYCALMACVEKGRSGVADVQAYLETQIPLGYVHLLCIMVKLHNVILTLLMAMVSVMHAGGAEGVQYVDVCRTGFRAFFMPFLYNSLLVLNSDFYDPFGEGDGNFDWSTFQANMIMSSKGYDSAVYNLPDCIEQWEDKTEYSQGPRKEKV